MGGPLLHPPAEDGLSFWVLILRPRCGTGQLLVGVGGGAGAQAGARRASLAVQGSSGLGAGNLDSH